MLCLLYTIIGLLCNSKAVASYPTVLTAWLQVCFWMNIVNWLHYIWLWFIYTVGTPMDMAYSHYMHYLLVNNTIHMCTCLMLYIELGTPVLCEPLLWPTVNPIINITYHVWNSHTTAVCAPSICFILFKINPISRLFNFKLLQAK